MKYQICIMNDGAKRVAILFDDNKPVKEMWTGDTKGWINITEDNKNRTVEECIKYRNFSHIRETNNPHEINKMLYTLERKGQPVEGYNPSTDTITIKI